MHTVGSESHRNTGDAGPPNLEDQTTACTHFEVVGGDAEVLGLEDSARIEESE